jgi:hypothetical protein
MLSVSKRLVEASITLPKLSLRYVAEKATVTVTIVHILVPSNRLFMCGSDPPSVPAMLDALKEYIHNAAAVVYELEVEIQL